MTWTMYYHDRPVFKRLTLEQVEHLSEQIKGLLEDGGGWFDLQSPAGDGITFQRMLVTANTPIMFDPS